MRIDFYVIADEHPDAFRRVATRLLEKSYAKNLRTWVLCANQAEAETLDDWLWSYKPDSFLPHSLASNRPEGLDPPIQITSDQTAPSGQYDLLLNLTENIPQHLDNFERILDLVAAHQKAAGRKRYKAYQTLNATLYHHNV